MLSQGAKENTFRELMNFLSGICDQCFIFRDQGSSDPPEGLISNTSASRPKIDHHSYFIGQHLNTDQHAYI